MPRYYKYEEEKSDSEASCDETHDVKKKETSKSRIIGSDFKDDKITKNKTKRTGSGTCTLTEDQLNSMFMEHWQCVIPRHPGINYAISMSKAYIGFSLYYTDIKMFDKWWIQNLKPKIRAPLPYNLAPYSEEDAPVIVPVTDKENIYTGIRHETTKIGRRDKPYRDRYSYSTSYSTNY